MISQLTKNERQLALVILLALTLCGLTLAIAGRNDPIGAHGLLVTTAGVLGIFGIFPGIFRRSLATIASTAITTTQARSASSSRWYGSCSASSSATGWRGFSSIRI